MYAGGWVGVGACPAVGGTVGTRPDPAAAGSDVFVFDTIVQIRFQLLCPPTNCIYTNVSRGRALD